MKKIITAIVALVLVAALSVGVWAITNKIQTTTEMDAVLSEIDGIGKEFLKSTAKPKETASAESALVNDSNDSTKWVAATNTGSYFQKDFDKLTTINAVVLKEVGSNVRKFHIDAWNGVEWVEVYDNDLIESYHQCILPETVMTYSIRVTIDKMKTTSQKAEISTLEAKYQAPIALDKEFVNMYYMTGCSYYHDWDPISPERMDTCTDVCIIGEWCFDKNGEFVIAKPIKGVGGFEKTVSPDSEEGKEFTKKSFETLVSYFGKKSPNIWICLTCLKQGPTGVNQGQTDIFNNDKIRTKFVEDVVKYCKENKVYGVDVDWEYPSTSSQWQAYGKLINDLSVALHNEGMEISTAQSVGLMGLSKDHLNKFDRVNIMSYSNVHAGTDGHHSTYAFSTVSTLDKFMRDYGVEREKIVLGLPWFAITLGAITATTDWKAITQLLYMDSDDGESIDPGVNFVQKWGFNGPNVLRDKIVYALQTRIMGIFCWQIKNDVVDINDKYSITALTQKTLDDFSFVKEN